MACCQSQAPASIEPHQKDYQPDAWMMYSIDELGEWVHLLTKRASHRTNLEKAQKDLYDAQNYLNMMQEHLNAAVACINNPNPECAEAKTTA